MSSVVALPILENSNVEELPPLYFVTITGSGSAFVGSSKYYEASWTDGRGKSYIGTPKFRLYLEYK
ncbi:hypothetical protein [Fulvivirga ligni]|uniref:hypothetical protein n=1 Tax=Fulvivirga ligni TaxID=2904246 RepID=UPI001F3A4063|nr:hypothetical protein [Fulvivirga ligni]UII21606.1 hypothetical protein LVD16_27645 [Fulvivirga ligni]